jgi:hypothetical protein
MLIVSLNGENLIDIQKPLLKRQKAESNLGLLLEVLNSFMPLLQAA